AQLNELVERYLEWDFGGEPITESVELGRAAPTNHAPILVHDVFACHTITLPCHPHEEFTTTLARYGYLASSPHHPETAFSFRLLGLFKVLSTRCSALSAQAFVKSMRYTDLLNKIVSRKRTMCRDTPHWCLKNACPPCTYKLEGEPALKIAMQMTMDGNNTQKRVERTVRHADGEGKIILSVNIERRDNRSVFGDYYLTPEEVNLFAYEVKRRLPPAGTTQEDIRQFAAVTEEGRPVDGADEPMPCTEKWVNMSEDAVKKMWGIYWETGIFLALCRHGSVLVMCDMIRSGELAKYPIAIMDHLVNVFGPNIMSGYDIGCSFSGTINNSPKVGPKIRQNNTCFCCGSFHGHAHCRLCQLDWHPLYIDGSGLEEYEGCERAFSDSNGTGRRTRYATRFHRQQILTLHFERWDKDKYQELSRFLYNNFCQAMKNLETLPDQLAAAKQKTYLGGLKKEPEADVLRLEYLETLMKLHKADQALELLLTLRTALLQLEQKLEIQITWTPDSPEWKEMQKYLQARTYRRTLNILEGLVVVRLFELTKVNQSGTGYKLCTHIAKAMKARSQAIQTAIKQYNDAAQALQPPCPSLDPKTVLDYVFLAEFDILRDARGNVQSQPWARPPERLAAVTSFKICRSWEEKLQVEVEARHLLTSIRDESHDYAQALARLQHTDASPAYQVAKVFQLRQIVNDEHVRVLTRLQKHRSFAGILGVGVKEGTVGGGDVGGEELAVAPEEISEDVDGSDEQSDDEDTAADIMESTIEAFNTFGD
ncbi:hypothetical protein K439DRAFT_1564199, partial [Ramaria rubella]